MQTNKKTACGAATPQAAIRAIHTKPKQQVKSSAYIIHQTARLCNRKGNCFENNQRNYRLYPHRKSKRYPDERACRNTQRKYKNAKRTYPKSKGTGCSYLLRMGRKHRVFSACRYIRGGTVLQSAKLTHTLRKSGAERRNGIFAGLLRRGRKAFHCFALAG